MWGDILGRFWGLLGVTKPIKWSCVWATLSNMWPRDAHSAWHTHSQNPPGPQEGLDSISAQKSGQGHLQCPVKVHKTRVHLWEGTCLRAPYWMAMKLSRFLSLLFHDYVYHWIWEDSQIFLGKIISVKTKRKNRFPHV